MEVKKSTYRDGDGDPIEVTVEYDKSIRGTATITRRVVGQGHSQVMQVPAMALMEWAWTAAQTQVEETFGSLFPEGMTPDEEASEMRAAAEPRDPREPF